MKKKKVCTPHFCLVQCGLPMKRSFDQYTMVAIKIDLKEIKQEIVEKYTLPCLPFYLENSKTNSNGFHWESRCIGDLWYNCWIVFILSWFVLTLIDYSLCSRYYLRALHTLTYSILTTTLRSKYTHCNRQGGAQDHVALRLQHSHE